MVSKTYRGLVQFSRARPLLALIGLQLSTSVDLDLKLFVGVWMMNKGS